MHHSQPDVKVATGYSTVNANGVPTVHVVTSKNGHQRRKVNDGAVKHLTTDRKRNTLKSVDGTEKMNDYVSKNSMNAGSEKSYNLMKTQN